jgi:hypothetical protein
VAFAPAIDGEQQRGEQKLASSDGGMIKPNTLATLQLRGGLMILASVLALVYQWYSVNFHQHLGRPTSASTNSHARRQARRVQVNVRFSNRPVGVKRFQTIHRWANELFAMRQLTAVRVRFGSKADIEVYSADVRFGSKADIEVYSADVRFTPKSGHWNSAAQCPLCAKLRH